MNALVLLSGGLDSAAALAWTVALVKRRQSGTVRALSFDYGQRHGWETLDAELLAMHYHASFTLMALDPFLFGTSGIMADAPPLQQVPADEPFPDTDRKNMIVPFRNGIFLSVAANVASRPETQADLIVIGTHVSSHDVDRSFPDCRVGVMQAMRSAITQGTDGAVTVAYPLQDKTKGDIVKYGTELDVPFKLTRSCFVAETPCTRCLECHARADAFAEAGIADPILA